MKSSQRIIIGLSLMTTIIFGGTVSATYAWFQLNQDKQIQVSGTSFGKSQNLSIGFVSDAPLNYPGLTYSREDSDKEGKNIYWVDELEADSDMVKYIIKANGYSEGNIFPVTSSKYEVGSSEFKLFDSPFLGGVFDYDTSREATKQYYIGLSFAFKVKGGSEATSDTPVEGAKVYMDDYQLSGSAKEAVRLHVSSESVSNSSVSSIIKPTSEESGYTDVGGALDLDQDGQYDHFYDENNVDREFYYGQRDDEIQYGEAYTSTVINDSKNLNCFINPNHEKGVTPLKDTSLYSSKAAYSSLSNYLYKGAASEGQDIVPMCITDTNGIGFTDMQIYLEGWDHALINQVIGSTIGTSISFTSQTETIA